MEILGAENAPVEVNTLDDAEWRKRVHVLRVKPPSVDADPVNVEIV